MFYKVLLLGNKRWIDKKGSRIVVSFHPLSKYIIGVYSIYAIINNKGTYI